MLGQIQEYRNREANEKLAKKLTVLVWAVSILVLVLVVLMREIKLPLPKNLSLDFLPPFNAFLNSIASVFLILALVFIKKGLVKRHLSMIYGAMCCSIIFLLSYVFYHFTSDATIYGDSNGDGELSEQESLNIGSTRSTYLFILISHITLAALSLPFILMNFVYGFTNQFNKHRSLAKKIFPVWLYVAVTGPIVYFLLRPYY